MSQDGSYDADDFEDEEEGAEQALVAPLLAVATSGEPGTSFVSVAPSIPKCEGRAAPAASAGKAVAQAPKVAIVVLKSVTPALGATSASASSSVAPVAKPSVVTAAGALAAPIVKVIAVPASAAPVVAPESRPAVPAAPPKTVTLAVPAAPVVAPGASVATDTTAACAPPVTHPPALEIKRDVESAEISLPQLLVSETPLPDAAQSTLAVKGTIIAPLASQSRAESPKEPSAHPTAEAAAVQRSRPLPLESAPPTPAVTLTLAGTAPPPASLGCVGEDHIVEVHSIADLRRLAQEVTALLFPRRVDTLRFNAYGRALCDRGAEAVAMPLARLGACSTLTSVDLDLSRNRIGDSGVAILSDALRELQNLRHLTLRLAGNAFESTAAASLATVIRGAAFVFLALDIRENLLRGSSVAELADSIRTLNIIKRLELRLRTDDEGLYNVAGAVRILNDLEALSLDFSQSIVSSDGGRAVAHALLHVLDRGKLKAVELNLAGATIADDGASSFARALAHGSSTLVKLELDFGACGIGSRGGRSLVGGLGKLRLLDSLRLALGGNALETDSADAVATALPKLLRLTALSLDLSGNAIRDAGVTAIAAGICRLHRVHTLHLGLVSACLAGESMEALGKAFGHIHGLRDLELNLRGNAIDDWGVKCLAKGLRACPSLTSVSLKLSNNCIGKAGSLFRPQSRRQSRGRRTCAELPPRPPVPMRLDMRYYNEASCLGVASVAEAVAVA